MAAMINQVVPNLLQGRVAVVTGASQGIGRAIAIEMTRQGAAVVVNASRSRQSAEKVVAEIAQDGGTAVVGMADVSDPADVDRLFADAQRKLGPIDILVNNAGIDVGTSWDAHWIAKRELFPGSPFLLHDSESQIPQGE